MGVTAVPVPPCSSSARPSQCSHSSLWYILAPPAHPSATAGTFLAFLSCLGCLFSVESSAQGGHCTSFPGGGQKCRPGVPNAGALVVLPQPGTHSPSPAAGGGNLLLSHCPDGEAKAGTAPGTQPALPSPFLLSTLVFPWSSHPAALDRCGQYGKEPNEESF